jgi:hypothetical protein
MLQLYCSCYQAKISLDTTPILIIILRTCCAIQSTWTRSRFSSSRRYKFPLIGAGLAKQLLIFNFYASQLPVLTSMMSQAVTSTPPGGLSDHSLPQLQVSHKFSDINLASSGHLSHSFGNNYEQLNTQY